MPVQRESKPTTRSSTFVPPYPPSWFNRFTAWVDRLPGPAWAIYLIFTAGVVLAGTAIQWMEGAYDVGTFNLLHVWDLGSFVYLFALMHYLDKSAASAFERFRPLLTSENSEVRPPIQDKPEIDELSYCLTTMRPRPTIIVTLAGVAFGIVWLLSESTSGMFAGPLAGAADTTLSIASILVLLVVGLAMSFVLLYHTIHQLALVSRIYTQYARISIYNLQPLYALSLPGAFTGIGLILFTYIWTFTGPSQVLGPVEIGLSLVFVLIAGATFVLPLLGAHRRLVAEKGRRLAETSSLFDTTTTQLHHELHRGSLDQMDQLNRALASLEIEQNVLRRIPTWPWRAEALRSLVAAVLLPLAVWAIQLLLGRFIGT